MSRNNVSTDGHDLPAVVEARAKPGSGQGYGGCVGGWQAGGKGGVLVRNLFHNPDITEI